MQISGSTRLTSQQPLHAARPRTAPRPQPATPETRDDPVPRAKTAMAADVKVLRPGSLIDIRI
jgi:hypothetical protein